MVQKVKNRHRVLLLSQDSHNSNDIFMLLSSHGYLVDVVATFEAASLKILNYKPSIFIADIALLPPMPQETIEVFNEARKHPVFLLINDDEKSPIVQSYLESSVDDLLTMPMEADKLYHKVKRAANYNRMQHEIAYHSGIVFMLKLIIPILMVIVFILTNRR